MADVNSERQSLGRAGAVRLILILGALTAFAALSIDMYLPAFPALQDHFGASPGAVQATLAVFFLGLAGGQAVFGPLSDRYGRRRPLLAGIVLYVGASFFCAMAPGIEALILARFIQAIGCCAGMVIARAMVADLFEERESARVFSFLMLVMGMAPILAPLIGSQLLVVFGWPSIFWGLGLFGLACLLAAGFGLGETLPPERRSRGGLGNALRVYRHLLRERSYLAFVATGSLSSAGMFAYITGSPFVFIGLYGMSPQNFGLLFGLNAVAILAASQINVRLLRHFSGRRILRAAVVLQLVAGLTLLAAALTGFGGLFGLAVPLFFGIGSLGFIMPNSTAAAMSRVKGHGGAGSALYGVTQFTFAAMAGSLVGLLQNGSAVPMALAIAGLTSTAFLVARAATRQS